MSQFRGASHDAGKVLEPLTADTTALEGVSRCLWASDIHPRGRVRGRVPVTLGHQLRPFAVLLRQCCHDSQFLPCLVIERERQTHDLQALRGMPEEGLDPPTRGLWLVPEGVVRCRPVGRVGPIASDSPLGTGVLWCRMAWGMFAPAV